MKNQYPLLFSPLNVNGTILRNRIIASPINYQISREKAVSGAAEIVIGCGFIDHPKAPGKAVPYLFSPGELAKTRERLVFWKQGGAKVSLELMHCGRYAFHHTPTDYLLDVCSGVRDYDGVPIRALTPKDMREIAGSFARAAADARHMGFDMVIIHCAHGWLLSSFLSPTWNHRTDEYGGSYENRVRFPMEVLRAVRKAVGPSYPIDMRINGRDWVGPGMSPEELVRFLSEASQEHLIDMVNITAGVDLDVKGHIHMASHAIHPHLVNTDISRYVKERVSIPVSVVGAIETPEEAEQVLESGAADAVFLGRALVADPFWPKKALEGRSGDIRPCIRCLSCTDTEWNRGCSVNPRLNREEQFPLPHPALKKKKVVVIGGGVGGMEAALTASRRGHDVILFVKNPYLGGILHFTDYVPGKRDLKCLKDYYIRQMEQSRVDIRLNTEVTPRQVQDLGPDAVMIAVGAVPAAPPLEGLDSPHVIQALDALMDLDHMPETSIIIGEGTVGCELAAELCELGKTAVIVEMTDRLNANGTKHYQAALSEHLDQFNRLTILTETSALEILPEGLKVRLRDDREEIFSGDRIILACGMKSRKEEAARFYGITPETYLIGDCSHPARVKEAICDGFMFAYQL